MAPGPSEALPLGPRNVWGVCRNVCGGRLRAVALGLSVELFLAYGATKLMRGVSIWVCGAHAGGARGAFRGHSQRSGLAGLAGGGNVGRCRAVVNTQRKYTA